MPPSPLLSQQYMKVEEEPIWAEAKKKNGELFFCVKAKAQNLLDRLIGRVIRGFNY